MRERNAVGQFIGKEQCMYGHPLRGDNLLFSTESNGYARRECRTCHRDVNRRSNQKLKAEVFAHYGNACSCCGEAHEEFLAIDHINGRGKASKDGYGATLYRVLRARDYPEGYRLLCHNCNMAFGLYGACPHG